jgi:glucan phosphorylase
MNDASTIEPLPRKIDAETIKGEIVDKLAYAVGKDPIVAKDFDWLAATILVVRDRAIDRWMESTRAAYHTGAKRVYYLSLEFLIGRLLRDAMTNLGLVEPIQAALKALGVDPRDNCVWWRRAKTRRRGRASRAPSQRTSRAGLPSRYPCQPYK